VFISGHPETWKIFPSFVEARLAVPENQGLLLAQAKACGYKNGFQDGY